MRSTIAKCFKALDPAQTRRLGFLQLVMIIVAFVDVFSAASLAPYLAILSRPSLVDENRQIRWVYDTLGFTDQKTFFVTLGIFVLVFIVFGNLLSLFSVWLLNRISCRMGAQLSSKLFRYYLNKDYLFHVAHNSAYLSSRVLNETQRLSFKIILPFLTINSKLIVVLIIFISIIVVNPWAALISSAIFGSCYLVIFWLVKKRLYRNSRIESVDNERRMKIVSEGLGGIKEIKLLGKEEVFARDYATVTDRYFDAISTTTVIGAAPKQLLEMVAFGGVISVLLYMVSSDQNIIALLPLLTFYVMAGYKLMPALQQIFAAIASFKGASAAFEAIRDDIQSIGEQGGRPAAQDLSALKFNDSITFRNVSYTYPGTTKLVLNSVSLSIKANTTVGFVGASGAGKSTLIDILLGLLEPSAGDVIIDSVTLEQAQIRAWQRQLGYVPQSIYLADCSVAENIALGQRKSEIDMERVRRVATIAHLEQTIAGMPNGYETNVGERGVQLSGGQRQRIGIARALYRQPPVVVLDEATSALDNVTEQSIMESIDALSGQKTIVMIAHRLSTVRNCDVIHFLEDGKISHSGTYDYLMTVSSTFRDMALRAARNDSEP